MKNFIDQLNNELDKLRNYRDFLTNRIKTYPEGSLSITNSIRSISYLHKTFSDGKYQRKYIKKENIRFAKILAQKSYDKSILEDINKNISAIENFIREYELDIFNKSFDYLQDERKFLVRPIEAPWNEFLSEWYKSYKIQNTIEKRSDNLVTKKGEIVRSKSELIIANELFDNNIEYKYEAGINLNGYGIVSPDFTILDRETRQEIYWEHFGRMDDIKYLDKFIDKIYAYNMNGLSIGDRLIVTFESSNRPINVSLIRVYIKRLIKNI